jgi:hypothetical protein
MLAKRGPEDLVALTCAQSACWGSEDLLDRIRMRENSPRVLLEVEAEDIA